MIECERCSKEVNDDEYCRTCIGLDKIKEQNKKGNMQTILDFCKECNKLTRHEYYHDTYECFICLISKHKEKYEREELF